MQLYNNYVIKLKVLNYTPRMFPYNMHCNVLHGVFDLRGMNHQNVLALRSTHLLFFFISLRHALTG